MLEQMRLCRALWAGGPVDWDGLWKVKQGELAPKPYTPGGPKIWSGGGVEAALKRSGRYFDGWFPSGTGGGKDRLGSGLRRHADCDRFQPRACQQ